MNRLVHHFSALSQVGGDLRPGIVHRLDKGTSGVLLVARNDAAHRALAAQFAGRTVEKTYLALVHGKVRNEQGRVTTPIARDPVRRIRMTAKLATGRSALTEYRVLRRFEKFTYLEVRIGTGRTHQIRVHLASVGHPVAGDKLYGAPAAERIFLHAWRIAFTSPATDQRVTVEAPLPEELTAVAGESIIGSAHMKYCLAAILCLALPLGAQAPKPPQPAKQAPVDEDPAARITLDVTRVNMLFTVSDKRDASSRTSTRTISKFSKPRSRKASWNSPPKPIFRCASAS